MLSRDAATAHRVEAEMRMAYTQLGIDYHTYVTTINQTGVSVHEIL